MHLFSLFENYKPSDSIGGNSLQKQIFDWHPMQEKEYKL